MPTLEDAYFIKKTQPVRGVKDRGKRCAVTGVRIGYSKCWRVEVSHTAWGSIYRSKVVWISNAGAAMLALSGMDVLGNFPRSESRSDQGQALLKNLYRKKPIIL